uniref:UDP-GlcNAc:betaGal beta-1,3-N-acetylglucosaminyltransferase 7-like n=1 Tax=Styela clava TaxID=7725 RepID=UPI001939D3EA|nr:UDP-GlcNAc:betaGal beta-1,3-N-acetylglucosaminyltransferase 7-like [Styela clava]
MARICQLWRALIFISCGLFISFDVWYHYSAHQSLSEITMKLFPRTLNEKAKVASIKRQVYKDNVDTKVLYSTTRLPTKASLPKTAFHPQDTLPGLISMDNALMLPALPPQQSKNNKDNHIFFYSQKRDHNFIISHNDTCIGNTKNSESKKDIFLLMAIKSMCKSRDRRKAIRRTWGNETYSSEVLGVKVKLIFLLGACENVKSQKELFGEDQQHFDILQWDFIDTFRNLTLKDCLYLQWFAKNCRHVPYIFKGDDDIFVNIGNILKFLKDLPVEKSDTIFIGSKLEGSPRIVEPKSKYFVSSNLFSKNYYPAYLSGGGFLLSGKLAVKFFLQTLKTRIIPIDDAFLGILAESLGIEPKNDRGFKSWGMRKVDPCRLSKIKTYHRASPKYLVKLWDDLLTVNMEKCGEETNDVFTRQN